MTRKSTQERTHSICATRLARLLLLLLLLLLPTRTERSLPKQKQLCECCCRKRRCELRTWC